MALTPEEIQQLLRKDLPVNPSYDELLAQATSIGILATARGFTSIIRPIKQTFMYEVTKQVEEGMLTKHQAKLVIKATRGEAKPWRRG